MKQVANIKSLIRAHYHACQAEDWDKAAEMVLETYEFLRYNSPESIDSLCKSLLPVDWQDGKQLITSTHKHIDILHRLGVTYYDLGEFVNSQKYLECCFALAQKTGYRIIEADSLSYIALNHQHLENYTIAIECLKKCLLIAREINLPNQECRALQFLGKTYEYLGDYQESIEYYLQAQESARQHGFLEGKVTAIGNLGGIYIRTQKYELAMDYINQYLETYQEFSEFGNQIFPLQDISNFRLNIRDSNELVDLIQQQTEIYIDLADRNNELSDVNVLITVYDALEEWKIFMNSFEKCLSVREETISFHSQVNFLYESGITYQKILDVNQDLENLYSHNREVMLLIELVNVFFGAKQIVEKNIKYNLIKAEKICINLELPLLTQIQKLQAKFS